MSKQFRLIENEIMVKGGLEILVEGCNLFSAEKGGGVTKVLAVCLINISEEARFNFLHY